MLRDAEELASLDVPTNAHWTFSTTSREVARAAELVPDVEPWSGICSSSTRASRVLPIAASGTCWPRSAASTKAIAAYAAGGDLERRAGFPPLHARTGYWHARTFLERGRPGDHERAAGLLAETIEITDRLGMRLLHEQATALLES